MVYSEKDNQMENLQEFMQAGRLMNIQQVLTLAKQLVKAIHEMHSHDYCFDVLEPNTVFVTDDQVRIELIYQCFHPIHIVPLWLESC